MSLRGLFTDHPASVGESYLEHMGNATGFALRMMLGGAACLVHAVLPFLFIKTASHTVEELNHRMVLHRGKGSLSNARLGLR